MATRTFVSTAPATAEPLTGSSLVLAALLIGLGNFLVVLDTTIANVSVPTIAAHLAYRHRRERG